MPERIGLMVGDRNGPEHVFRSVLDREQHVRAIRRPRFGNVRFTLCRLRQALNWARAVGTTHEDPQVALAVGLKRDALSVGGPDGKTAAVSNRQPPDGARSREFVNPHARLFGTVVAADSQPAAVARGANVNVWTCL